MRFLVVKRAEGVRVWFTVASSAGVIRAGLTAGNFTVAVVSPNDAASATYAVAESTQKPGLYFFDVPALFLTTNGVGGYVAVIEVNAATPALTAVASTVLDVSNQDIDGLNSLVQAVIGLS